MVWDCSALGTNGVVVAGWPWGGSLTTEATLGWDSRGSGQALTSHYACCWQGVRLALG